MHSRPLLGLLAALLAVVGPRGALSAELPPVVLDLSAVVRLAGSLPPALKIADARIAEVRASESAAASQWHDVPRVGLSVGPGYASGVGAQAEIEAALPISLAGRTSARFRAARAWSRAAEHGATSARRQTILPAVVAWLDVLLARADADLAARRVDLARQARQAADDRHRHGAATRFEVDLADMELARAMAEQAQAVGNVRPLLTLLRTAVGLPAETALDVQGRLEAMAWPALPADATPTRPELLAFQSEVTAAQAELELARLPSWTAPTVRLAWSHEPDSDAVVAGVEVPLGGSALVDADRQRSAARLTMASARLQAEQLAIERDVQAARERLAVAEQALGGVVGDLLPRAERHAATALDAYRAGKLGLHDWLAIRRDLLEIQKQSLTRLYDVALAEALLRDALGRLAAPAKE